ncbi:hypothetical protein DPMN_096943 [Dreissena polymorpha]|uniref:Uncharacterized protein n=1 Tax=Dreissena polymorpha TaxID=45954 RepID=A0A9D4R443_DREPO|nr:hypothetical protein DPMN_096943 [Dreissena polymorpha]
MTEEMQNRKTLSTIVTSANNSAIHDFADVTYTSKPQHKESTEARSKGDASDLEIMVTKSATCSPYTADPTVRNIVDGIVAGSDVNVHAFEHNCIKINIIKDSIGKSAFTRFKRKDIAKILANSTAVL